ncbi:hypothetical protein PanWU01x14_248280 [Parasponia andersonii]|uniref:Uncharacterized protein n=1 Tax=Parasponia andersonii TaxID=3476 RepID=A0A2P5BDN9_PARAD|nr:hypothetical protein PanWU01x14_248280 [Parasponia andersonii]
MFTHCRYWGLEWTLTIHHLRCCFSLTGRDLDLMLERVYKGIAQSIRSSCQRCEICESSPSHQVDNLYLEFSLSAVKMISYIVGKLIDDLDLLQLNHIFLSLCMLRDCRWSSSFVS